MREARSATERDATCFPVSSTTDVCFSGSPLLLAASAGGA